MNANRRQFITGLTSLIGGVAIQDAIPLGRVWSFPSKIILAKGYEDSRYFVRITQTVGKNKFCTEIYDRADFYGSKHPVPVKVNNFTYESGIALLEQPSRRYTKTAFESPILITG